MQGRDTKRSADSNHAGASSSSLGLVDHHGICPSKRTRSKERKSDSSNSGDKASRFQEHTKTKDQTTDAMLEDTFTTLSGHTVTLQTAGQVVSSYIQAVLAASIPTCTYSYTLVPPLNPIVRKHPPKPAESHQPPPDHLFLCTITLPPQCPIHTVISPGHGHRSKDLAKKHALLALVRKLVVSGDIEPNLKPNMTKVPHTLSVRKAKQCERVAQRLHTQMGSPINSPDTNEQHSIIPAFNSAMVERLPGMTDQVANMGNSSYPHFTRSSFWDTCHPLNPAKIYPTLVRLDFGAPYESKSEECRVLCMITSRRLTLFGGDKTLTIDASMPEVGMDKVKVDATVTLVQGSKMKEWEEGKLQDVMVFNERVIRAQLNKAAKGDLQHVKWLIVPMTRDFTFPDPSAHPAKVRRRDIAWDEISLATGPIWRQFSTDLSSLRYEILDAMTSSRSEFSRRVYVSHIRSDLEPSSAHPVIADKTIAETMPITPTLTHPSQPIIVGEQVYPMKSGGVVASMALPNLEGRYLIPEITQKHCISSSVFRTSSILPGLLTSLDDILVAHEFSTNVFDGTLHDDLALLALSPPSAHSTTPGKSYQRLEMLGDTLLKLLSAVFFLYKAEDQDPINWDQLHQDRQVMVSNRSLQARSISAGVVYYIRGVSGRLKNWFPYGWVEEKVGQKVEQGNTMSHDGTQSEKNTTKGSPRESQVFLGDKTLADVAEALIAASYLSANNSLDGAITAMHLLRMPIEGFDSWDVVHRHSVQNSMSLLHNRKGHTPVPISLFKYTFTRLRIGRDALSLSTDPTQRSRFSKYKILGDAVLDYFLVEYLYNKYPDAGPGPLTVMRHSRHGDSCLAAYCVVSGLAELVTDIPVLEMPSSKKYRTAVLGAKKDADRSTSGPARCEFWAEIPALHFLGDVVNAVVGAILVDSHYHIPTVHSVYLANIQPFMEKYCSGPQTSATHPRTDWTEMLNKRGCLQWEIRKEDRREKGHTLILVTVILHTIVVGRGQAETQSIATRKACEDAICNVKSGHLLDQMCTCEKRRKWKS